MEISNPNYRININYFSGAAQSVDVYGSLKSAQEQARKEYARIDVKSVLLETFTGLEVEF